MRTKRLLLVAALLSLVALGSASMVGAEQAVTVVARVKPILEIDGLKFKDLNNNGKLDPYEDWRLSVDDRVENLLSLMTIEEKAGQMLHPNVEVPLDGVVATETKVLEFAGLKFVREDPRTLIENKHITNILNNGVAPPATFAAWSNAVQEIAEGTRLGIPVVFSSDPRHGASLGAHVQGSQYFSQWPSREGNFGLAATRDLKLAEEFGRVVAEEYRAVGLHMILGPQIDVVTEPRWGRDAGCFSEDAQLTADMVAAFIRGCQGEKIGKDSVLCMVKHWPGSGPHKGGTGNLLVYPGKNFDYHLIPFEAAFKSGAVATMSYYSIPGGYDTVGTSYSKFAIRDTLRDRLGFDGVVCTDWGVMSWAAYGVENLSVKERYAVAIEAGVDQFGLETDPTPIVELVKEGTISEARIDQSVKRILRQAFQLGLFENPYVDTAKAATVVKSAKNQALGYECQLKSIVLLTNNGTLPAVEARLDVAPSQIRARKTRVFVSGIDAAVAGQYAEVVDDPANADLAVLRVDATESGLFGPAEGTEVDISFPEETMAMIKAVADTGVPTVVAVNLGSTLVVLPQELVDTADALLMLFDVVDNALLDVVFGRFNPTGRLPFDLPSSMESVRKQLEDVPFDLENPLFRYGHGLSYK